MSKETLQHTMRSKVRVFEDGGIRLLRKGQKGLIHAIFSRFGLVLVLLVLQFGALFSLMRWFSGLLPHYLGGTLLVTAAMMVYLLNQDMNNSVRIPWLVVTALAPVLGVLLFCYTKEDVEKFRTAVQKYLVPVADKICRRQAERLGKSYPLSFADLALEFRSGNPCPVGTPDDILAQGMKFYGELPPRPRSSSAPCWTTSCWTC